MIGHIAKLLAALNSESSPRQLALAIALGMIVGLTPTLSLHNAVVLLIVFVIRVNLSAFFVSAAVFGGLGLAFGGVFALIGADLLLNPEMEQIWTGFYQLTIFKLAHLHHTLTLGSLVFSLGLFIPLYFVSHWLIVSYRQHFMAFINKFKVVQALKSSRLYQAYETYAS